MKSILSILVVCSVLFVADAAPAQVPTVMNYQGRLTDNTPGQNPIDATLPMEFRIYGSAMGVDLLWSESWAGGVMVTNGIFSVLLGSNGSPLSSSVFTSGTDRYLEIEVDLEILSPRQQLGAAGWAHQAGNALDADGLGGEPAENYQKRVTGACAAGSSIRTVGADGSVSCEFDDVGILTETDPQVGALATNQVPRWDGSSLGAGSIFDNGTNVGIGTTSGLEDLHVYRPDSDVARIYATGVGQGAGMLYVGQSTTFGGGIAYDGDGNPDIVGGSDRVTFFRRSSGADSEVMSYSYNNSQVSMDGGLELGSALSIDGSTVIDDAGGWHRTYGNTGWYNSTHGGGMYMTDSTWVRTYANKSLTTGSGNLDVDGTSFIGYSMVNASYPVETLVSSCHSHGNLACYQGSGCALCPAGTVVIGGGCFGPPARYGSVSASYPSGGTQWCCASSYDISGTDLAFAVCARVGN